MAEPNEPLTKAEREELLRFARELAAVAFFNAEDTTVRISGTFGGEEAHVDVTPAMARVLADWTAAVRWEATVAKLEGVLGRIANHRHASAIDPGGDSTLLEVVERIERWALDALYPKRREPKPEPLKPKPEPPKPRPKPKPDTELPAQTSFACIEEAHDQCNGECIPWRVTKGRNSREWDHITTGKPRPCQCPCHRPKLAVPVHERENLNYRYIPKK